MTERAVKEKVRLVDGLRFEAEALTYNPCTVGDAIKYLSALGRTDKTGQDKVCAKRLELLTRVMNTLL